MQGDGKAPIGTSPAAWSSATVGERERERERERWDKIQSWTQVMYTLKHQNT